MAQLRVERQELNLGQGNIRRGELPPQAPLGAAGVAIVALPIIAFLGALYYKSQNPAYLGAALISVPTLLFSLFAANGADD